MKNKVAPSSCIKSSLNEIRKTSKRSFDENSKNYTDEVAQSSSDVHENFVEDEDEDEETVVVIKKRGNRVFIEL